ncbi:MAG: hypothetical protein ACPGYT_14040 [Nitrospirales bacterium]
MEQQHNKPTEGKRVGLHPAIVLFGVIVGLWLFITMIIPKEKNTKHQAGMPSQPVQPLPDMTYSEDVVPVFSTSATIQELNIINLVVPPATTDSQIGALLNHLKMARQNNTLADLIPATTPGHELGSFAIADIYIFSESQHGIAQTTRVLSRGAHAPSTIYGETIPYEMAMEQVRGHYSVNLHNRTTPETGSLGFGEEETGVYSKRYQKIF